MNKTPERKTALQDMSEFLTARRDNFAPGSDEYDTFDKQITAADLADLIVSTFGSDEIGNTLSQAMTKLALASPEMSLLTIRAMAAALRFYELGLSDAQARLDALDEATRETLLKAAE